MALFAISDLHLSFGTDKPMDIFGHRWEGYEEKLRNNWENMITNNDTVILNGDLSWATYLEDAALDFSFINSLTGHKIIMKGNHDYWWSTLNKQRKFCEENGFTTIDFLQNECVIIENTAVCGTRGWQLSSNDSQDKKIYDRELIRLELSLKAAKAMGAEDIIAALHYPPDDAFKKLMTEYNVRDCVYGHLHGSSHTGITDTTEDGITYRLVSCDYLNFVPVPLRL